MAIRMLTCGQMIVGTIEQCRAIVSEEMAAVSNYCCFGQIPGEASQHPC